MPIVAVTCVALQFLELKSSWESARREISGLDDDEVWSEGEGSLYDTDDEDPLLLDDAPDEDSK